MLLAAQSFAPAGNMPATILTFQYMLVLFAASEGMLKCLKAPTLRRPFVLDLLDFVLGNSAAVFRYNTALLLMQT